MTASEQPRVTIPSLRARKGTGEKIVSITAYDYAVASIMDAVGVDILLVGDSLGMVLLGYENTLPVTMDEMIDHTKPVARAARRALVVGDMPFMSYHLSAEQAVENGGRFIKEGGAEAVKIEGASPRRVRLIETLVEADIPVLGHVGLTPQSVGRFGGFKVQGTTPEPTPGASSPKPGRSKKPEPSPWSWSASRRKSPRKSRRRSAFRPSASAPGRIATARSSSFTTWSAATAAICPNSSKCTPTFTG